MRARTSLRGLAVATATVVATGFTALGVSAFAEGPPGSVSPAAALVAPPHQNTAEAALELTREKHGSRAAAVQLAAKRAAAAKAATVAAARKRAAEERARAAKARASRSAERTGDPRSIARAMLSDHGWSSGQFSCLESLWQKESGWNVHADNPSSSAYGIPQALPGRKMASAGSDWESNPATQIKWGLGYIADSYGSPCSAWAHSESNGWY